MKINENFMKLQIKVQWKIVLNQTEIVSKMDMKVLGSQFFGFQFIFIGSIRILRFFAKSWRWEIDSFLRLITTDPSWTLIRSKWFKVNVTSSTLMLVIRVMSLKNKQDFMKLQFDKALTNSNHLLYCDTSPLSTDSLHIRIVFGKRFKNSMWPVITIWK